MQKCLLASERVCVLARKCQSDKRCAFAALQPAVMWYGAVIDLALLRLHVRETTLSARFQIGKWKAPRVHAHIKNCAHKLIAIEFQVHPNSSMTLRMSAKMNCGCCSDDLIYFLWFFSLSLLSSRVAVREVLDYRRRSHKIDAYTWIVVVLNTLGRACVCMSEWSADARITFGGMSFFFGQFLMRKECARRTVIYFHYISRKYMQTHTLKLRLRFFGFNREVG